MEYKIYYWTSEFDRNKGYSEVWETRDNLADAIDEAKYLYRKGIACVEVRNENVTYFMIENEFNYNREGVYFIQENN